jgi:hypothetical protein
LLQAPYGDCFQLPIPTLRLTLQLFDHGGYVHFACPMKFLSAVLQVSAWSANMPHSAKHIQSFVKVHTDVLLVSSPGMHCSCQSGPYHGALSVLTGR